MLSSNRKPIHMCINEFQIPYNLEPFQFILHIWVPYFIHDGFTSLGVRVCGISQFMPDDWWMISLIELLQKRIRSVVTHNVKILVSTCNLGKTCLNSEFHFAYAIYGEMYLSQYHGHALRLGLTRDKDWPRSAYWVPLSDTRCLLQWVGTRPVSWPQDGWLTLKAGKDKYKFKVKYPKTSKPNLIVSTRSMISWPEDELPQSQTPNTGKHHTFYLSQTPQTVSV